MAQIQCPQCLIVSEPADSTATFWDCPCGSSFHLRRCASCSSVTQVGSLHKRGEPWNCAWCGTPNTGYATRNDPAAATVSDMAADLARHGREFAARPASSASRPPAAPSWAAQPQPAPNPFATPNPFAPPAQFAAPAPFAAPQFGAPQFGGQQPGAQQPGPQQFGGQQPGQGYAPNPYAPPQLGPQYAPPFPGQQFAPPGTPQYGPMAGALIVTTNDIPGYRITRVHGDVFGLIVRARNALSNLGASFRTLAGGEVAGYTRLLTDSRNEARERMWQEARGRGANAVIAMRFDCNEIGGVMSEVAAYGTAVTVEPLQPASQPGASQFGASQPGIEPPGVEPPAPVLFDTATSAPEPPPVQPPPA